MVLLLHPTSSCCTTIRLGQTNEMSWPYLIYRVPLYRIYANRMLHCVSHSVSAFDLERQTRQPPHQEQEHRRTNLYPRTFSNHQTLKKEERSNIQILPREWWQSKIWIVESSVTLSMLGITAFNPCRTHSPDQKEGRNSVQVVFFGVQYMRVFYGIYWMFVPLGVLAMNLQITPPRKE